MRTYTFPEIHPAGPGPWDDEPDKAQWIDETTGLDCLIVRNRVGSLCGYVGVPPSHRLHGTDYDDVYATVPDLQVHGGLTFAGRSQEGTAEGHGVCHVPEPGRPADVWWLGFDCAHAGDLCPAFGSHLPHRLIRDDVYRDFDYVRAEVERLAQQLTEQPGEVTNR